MFIYTKMPYPVETWLSASLLYVQPNHVETEPYALSTRIVGLGFAIARQDSLEPFANALFVQQILVNTEVLV